VVRRPTKFDKVKVVVTDGYTSDLSRDSRVGQWHDTAPLPVNTMDELLGVVEEVIVDAPYISDVYSSSEESTPHDGASDLSTHVGRSVDKYVPQVVGYYDVQKGSVKDNLLPRHNPGFDTVKAASDWVPGIKLASAVLNPLVDYADSELLHSSDINDIMLDHFYPLMDVGVPPENRNRGAIVARAFNLAQLYNPMLIHGHSLEDWKLPELQHEFESFLDTLRPKFERGGAERRAAIAAADYNWDTFPFPDEEELKMCHGHVVDLIRKKQHAARPDRINLERITEHLGDYPGFELLREVVVDGVWVFPDSKYRKNMYEEMRAQEKILQSVICKHAMDSFDNDRCIIVRESKVSKSLLASLNFNPSFWVFKWTDVFGRWCLDGSNRADRRMPLNGGKAKDYAKEHYGKVVYPEMVDIILAWMEYKKKYNKLWKELWLFKEDIRSCFPQLNMLPEAALHLAMRVAVDIILINFCGTFGYTGLPGAWQVVGRALLWKALQTAMSCLHLFADDFFGLGTWTAVQTDSVMVQHLIVKVLGLSAAAPAKHELAQKLVILGWWINLIDKRGGASIRPKDEALEKLMHYFFSFDEYANQTREFWEVLAGLVERFSLGIIGARHHVQVFHGMKKQCEGTKNDRVSGRHRGGYSKTRPATAGCRFSIVWWRVHLSLMYVDRDRFAVSLEQFVCLAGKSVDPIQFIGISDACSKRIAVAIYSANRLTPGEIGLDQLVGWISVPLEYDYSKAGYTHQNYVEFIGVVLQVVLMNILFPLSSRADSFPMIIQSKGDNMSANSWMLKQKCASEACQTACFVQSYLQIFSRIDVASVVHHPGKDMKDIDIESRRDEFLEPTEFCTSLPPELEIDCDAYPIVRRFIQLANPTVWKKCEKDMHKAYLMVAKEFGAFVHRPDPECIQFKTLFPRYELVEFNHENKTRLSSSTCYVV
jgi:hypothetical protein